MTNASAVPDHRFEPLELDALRWHDPDEAADLVPVVDHADLMSGRCDDVLRTTLAAGRPFYLADFGIAEKDIERVFNCSREFFNRPEAEKAAMVHPELPRILRGYSAYGTGAYENSLNEGSAINQYTKYAWGPERNVAPNDDFRATFTDMFARMSDLAGEVVQAIGAAFDLRGLSEWPNLFEGQDRVLHCQFYYPEPPLNGDRMVSHADASVVTLLTQLPAPSGHVGLKAEIDDEYRPVPELRGTLVVMAGEALNAFSGGRIKPTLHAVTGPRENVEGSGRSSMPFFLNPRDELLFETPEETTHGKFYDSSGRTTFGRYSQNIADAYARTENARV